VSRIPLDGERGYSEVPQKQFCRNQSANLGECKAQYVLQPITAAQVLDVALGLEHLHSLKLVHGDLKVARASVCIDRFQQDTNSLTDQRPCDFYRSRSASGFRGIVSCHGFTNPRVIIHRSFAGLRDHEMASV
jgi:serine/threonine protein kinase